MKFKEYFPVWGGTNLFIEIKLSSGSKIPFVGSLHLAEHPEWFQIEKLQRRC